MGTNNSAVKAAGEADAGRQAQIAAATSQINNAYNSPARQQQYADYGTNLTKYYTGQVNDQEAVNARNLKFAMARSGLQGGSASVDANSQLQKDYTKGLLQASQAAGAGKAALQQADTNSKNQMIALAEQGAYTGAVPTQVDQAQQAALGAAGNYANANSLGNLFSSTAGVYQNEQTAAANRRAQQTPIGSPYGSTAVNSPFQR
jgi:hypothetical protein